MSTDAAAVIHEHAAFVWRVLRHLGVAETQLPDVSQEVFVVLLAKLPEFEGRSSLRTWIFGICRKVAAGARRSRPARNELLGVELVERGEPASQDRELWLKQAHAQLVEALDCLDEEQRSVFVLYEIEELTMEEIATAAGAPLTTCYSRLQAARSKLETLLRRKEQRLRLLHGGAR
jgi:RNA polymerase sigma-70 factor (ECF subfamily)